MDLAKRSILSISWNFIANLGVNGLVFLRAIILARLLPVEVFGIYAGLRAILDVTVTLTDFGLGTAFIHRAAETEDEDRAASVHFSLRFVFLATWVALAVTGAFLFLDPGQRNPFLWLVGTTCIYQLTWPARAILARRVEHRRAAFVTFLWTVSNALTAVLAAWMGWGIYAIVAGEVATSLTVFLGFYIVRPVWKPKFAWDPAILRYYLDFGRRAFAANLLYHLLDHVDDLWTRFRLGELAMGFYSRAYRFASYPRLILATPVTQVIGGTYAELKYDRHRLSQAFFRTNALLVRSGFLLAGWMALIAPEFIRILLTSKWLPMLEAFRLMLVFALLDPLKLSISEILNAVGKPELVVRARLVQLGVLLAGLFFLSPAWGITGVAVAVDAMLVVGIAILLWQVKRFVDYSFSRLFLSPSIALCAGIAAALSANYLAGMPANDWASGFIKSLAFSLAYLLAEWLMERDLLKQMLAAMLRVMQPPIDPQT